MLRAYCILARCWLDVQLETLAGIPRKDTNAVMCGQSSSGIVCLELVASSANQKGIGRETTEMCFAET